MGTEPLALVDLKEGDDESMASGLFSTWEGTMEKGGDFGYARAWIRRPLLLSVGLCLVEEL